MIVFITLKSSLVPLIEGVCSLDSNSWFYVHIFCLSFSEDKTYKTKKVDRSRSHAASQYNYTHVYFVHIYVYIYAEI